MSHLLALNACAELACLDKGKLIHENIIKNDSINDIALNNALLHMYGKCGDSDNAFQIFNAIPKGRHDIIMRCAKTTETKTALLCFTEMQSKYGIFIVLSACSNSASYHFGKSIQDIL